MQVRLVGTGAGDGWPVPGCTCVGCRSALLSGSARTRLAAVVDGRLSLGSGGVVAAGRYDVQPTGAAWSVTGPDGTRLLWAPHSGAETEGAPYDGVFLGLDDLATWPLDLAALRRAGAVTATTYVAAVGVGHGQPPEPELHALLAGWGAQLPADGDLVELPAPPPDVRPARVLVVGGARSGKSAWAEQRLAAEPSVTYVATAPPRPEDAEWDARVQAHVARRPATWQTVETTELTDLLARPEALLVDDLGLWLTALLEAHDAWEGPVPPGVDQACTDLQTAWSGRTGPAVLVAPEVGGGVVPATASGRRFRDLLGSLTARLAVESDQVVQVVAGLPRALR